mmetsp:Transcript_15159/g.17014  ORF Transcript_15159/g.17014 Transcript_15159/m.17014 type:complete len:243 (+) Transcript_15159:549-1277(+)
MILYKQQQQQRWRQWYQLPFPFPPNLHLHSIQQHTNRKKRKKMLSSTGPKKKKNNNNKRLQPRKLPRRKMPKMILSMSVMMPLMMTMMMKTRTTTGFDPTKKYQQPPQRRIRRLIESYPVCYARKDLYGVPIHIPIPCIGVMLVLRLNTNVWDNGGPPSPESPGRAVSMTMSYKIMMIFSISKWTVTVMTGLVIVIVILLRHTLLLLLRLWEIEDKKLSLLVKDWEHPTNNNTFKRPWISAY